MIQADHTLPVEDSDLDRIQPAMQKYIDEGNIAGVSTLVTRNGTVIHSGCYGMLDKDTGKPLRLDSIFRIYSLTKPITAVALLMLVEEGKLKLDDPISGYFPKLRHMKVHSRDAHAKGEATLEEMQREITIRHLLTHTSGLAYGIGIDDHPVEEMYQEAGLFSKVLTLQMSLSEVVDQVAELPLATQPGSAWRYSIAYDVIGNLIEFITDKPLGVLLKERIFDPLGMIDTGFFVSEEERERFGPMYSCPKEGTIFALDKGEDSPFLDPDITPSGGAGLVSTMSDYSRFLALLTNGGQWENVRLLPPDAVTEMTSNQLSGRQLPMRFVGNRVWHGMGYGLGLGVQIDHAPNAGWPEGTYGWMGVSGAWAWTFPKESVSVIAMPQAWLYWEPGNVFQQLAYEAISS